MRGIDERYVDERHNTKDCTCGDSQAPSWWNDLQNEVFQRLFPPCPEHDEAGTERADKIMDAKTVDDLATALSNAMEANIASNAELADKLRNIGLWLSDGAKFSVRRPDVRGKEATPYASTGPKNLSEINRVNDAKYGRKSDERTPIKSLADINGRNAAIHQRGLHNA